MRGFGSALAGGVAVDGADLDDGVDLEIEQSAVHSVIGPNGAARATLFNLLTGVLPPAVPHAGRAVTGPAPLIVKQAAGIVPEIRRQG